MNYQFTLFLFLFEAALSCEVRVPCPLASRRFDHKLIYTLVAIVGGLLLLVERREYGSIGRCGRAIRTHENSFTNHWKLPEYGFTIWWKTQNPSALVPGILRLPLYVKPVASSMNLITFDGGM